MEGSETRRCYKWFAYNSLWADAVREILCSNFYWVRSKNCEKLLFASSCLSLRLDFREIYFFIFRKSVEKMQVSLTSGKNNGYFAWRPAYRYDNISLNSS